MIICSTAFFLVGKCVRCTASQMNVKLIKGSRLGDPTTECCDPEFISIYHKIAVRTVLRGLQLYVMLLCQSI